MQEVFTRKAFLTREEFKRYSTPSDWRGAWQLARHLGALAVSGALVWYTVGTGWVLAAWLMHGILLNFLFCALHETIHLTAFRSRSLNRAVAALCGLVVGIPPVYFRHFHFNHHRHTQDPERDPELLGDPEGPATLAQYGAFLIGLRRVWWRELQARMRHARGIVEEPFIPVSARRAVIAEARIFLVCYLALALGSAAAARPEILYYWLIPLLIGRPFLSAYLLAEHRGCETGTVDMLANTRTTLTNPLVRMLAWNMPYHVEHHLFPGVPFHALHRVHEHVKPHHRFLARGYLRFHAGYLAEIRHEV